MWMVCGWYMVSTVKVVNNDLVMLVVVVATVYEHGTPAVIWVGSANGSNGSDGSSNGLEEAAGAVLVLVVVHLQWITVGGM